MSTTRKKYFLYSIEFATEAEREEFRNYLFSIKMKTGKTIPRIALEMKELHKEKYSKEDK